MRFPAEVLEASALESALLLKRGESLGARSRLQDAFVSFQELWSRVPEAAELTFLGRPDIHQFREAIGTVAGVSGHSQTAKEAGSRPKLWTFSMDFLLS